MEIEKEFMKYCWFPSNEDKQYEYKVFANGVCVITTHFAGLASLKAEACKKERIVGARKLSSVSFYWKV
jgi:hypothetical protein